MNYQVVDNFLTREEFNKIHDTIMSTDLAWQWADKIVDDDDLEFLHRSQFVSPFYHYSTGKRDGVEILKPILDRLCKGKEVLRIKANLQTYSPNPTPNKFHVDMLDEDGKAIKDYYTSIFYLNTCNGATIFEDGTEIASVANRMLTFDGELMHTGRPASDAKRRVVINFNYK